MKPVRLLVLSLILALSTTVALAAGVRHSVTPDNIAKCPLEIKIQCFDYVNRYEFEMSAVLPPSPNYTVEVIYELSDDKGWVAGSTVRTLQVEGRDHWRVSVRKDAVGRARVEVGFSYINAFGFDAWIFELGPFAKHALPLSED